VYNFAGVPKGQNYHVFVELHKPGHAAHVSWRTMVGCVNIHNCSTSATNMREVRHSLLHT
jgi:hypothetical protein